MILTSKFQPSSLSLKDTRTYLIIVALIASNIILPQLCHFLPVKNAGPVLLPIYFFTLIGSYKFGFKVGILTAVLSPVFSNLLFAMPTDAMLPIILTKSALLAVIASYVASKTKAISLIHIVVVVAGYQLSGGLAEWLITGSLHTAVQDFTIGLPGIVIQILGGYLLLRFWQKQG